MLLIFSSAQSHFSAMNSAGTAIVMQAGTSAPFSGPVPPQQDTLPRPPSPYMAAIRLLSLALAFMGVLSCVAGGLGVHYVQYALDVAEWPTTSGSGAWCGSLVGTHYSEVMWALWCLKSQATPLFVQQLVQAYKKGNIKAPH